MLMISDGVHLCGLSFLDNINNIKETNLDIFDETKIWLDEYFFNHRAISIPKIKLDGTTFQKEVWDILLDIPYGNSVSYKDIASIIEKKRGISKMSAQAIGGAIKNNPIAIIIPCHRVIGSNNKLTGYKWGLERKERLLRLEGIIKEF